MLGRDIVKEKVSILREVGYLPSESQFYPGMKVSEILRLSADLRGMDIMDMDFDTFTEGREAGRWTRDGQNQDDKS